MKKIFTLLAIMMAITASAKDVVFDATSDVWNKKEFHDALVCTKDGVTVDISWSYHVTHSDALEFNISNESGRIGVGAEAEGNFIVTGIEIDGTPYEGIGPWTMPTAVGTFKISKITVHLDDTPINYWLAGTATENGWDVYNAMPMKNDKITRHLAAGTYEFKVLTQKASWVGSLGMANLNKTVSSSGLFSDGNSDNICFELENESDVTIAVVEGMIVVTIDDNAAGISASSADIEATKIVKAIENDKVVIIRKGKKYNASAQEVK